MIIKVKDGGVMCPKTNEEISVSLCKSCEDCVSIVTKKDYKMELCCKYNDKCFNNL